MLKLQANDVDICRVSKLIAKYNIKSKVTNKEIVLEGNIQEELLMELCDIATISKVQNFIDEEEQETYVKIKKQKQILEAQVINEYDLIYKYVKYGEVYMCDFGKPYKSEIGYIRPAIVTQGDTVNKGSSTTIVLPCSSVIKKHILTHYECKLYWEMLNKLEKKQLKKSDVLVDDIKSVDKTRLRKYIGTMKPETMDKIQEIIDIALGRKRQRL